VTGLTLRDVCKAFDGNTILDNISLELSDGELLVLLGPSGCGKSTLLRIIAGLEEGDSGAVHIGKRRVDKLPPRDRNVALVFQNYSLYPHMTVEKNLGFPLKVSGVSRSETRQRVAAVAELLGMTERLQSRPGQLSGGQRQRVALGRAIIREPSLFLLDEPLSNLDADLRVKMRQEIVRIQKELKRSMIHVTHDQVEALTMADRIALLHNGRLQQLGTPEELYKTPVNRFVAEFIGLPKINMVEAKVEQGRLIPFGFEWAGEDRSLLVGLRPEGINVPGDGDYSATVTGCEYVGDSYVGNLQFNEYALTASSLQSAFEPGQTVRFSFERRDLLCFDAVTGERVIV
jgi:ABC-type sugar transport system ATPase subunit